MSFEIIYLLNYNKVIPGNSCCLGKSFRVDSEFLSQLDIALDEGHSFLR